VPEHLKSRHWAGPIVFGLLLGAGIFTYLPSAVVYIYFFALLLLATPASGAVAGAVFGLAYATGVLILGARTRTLPPIGQAASVKQLFASSRQVTLLAAAVLSVLTTLVESPL